MYQSLACRTPRLGYASFECVGCQTYKYIYRSCGNRFCAQCGVHSTYKWGRESLTRLIDMKHHHVVFTLPKPLRHISKLNGDKLHDLLFKSSSEVMQKWFSKKHQLKPGMFTVLHTAGSDLKYHPHVHMVITGGGLSEEGKRIIELEKDYLTRQRFIGGLFRNSFINRLRELDRRDEIVKPKKWKDNKSSFSKWLGEIKSKHWIISIQKPLRDLNQIVGYVGRYTKRACLSEYKIESISEGIIKFRYNDYKGSSRKGKVNVAMKSMGYVEFLDELLQHVPSKGFRMVRYSGIYTSHYKKYLPAKQEIEEVEEEGEEWGEFEALRKLDISKGNKDQLICPNCQREYVFIEIVYPGKKTKNGP